MLYPPAEFKWRGKVYRDGDGAGSVFLDWLIALDRELIGIQLDTDILLLDGYGRSTLTREAKEQRMLEAERNLGRDYVTRQEHRLQVWFGSRRDVDPEVSCHQYLLCCNYEIGRAHV